MSALRSDISSCILIELGKIHNPAGNITILQNGFFKPFKTKRIYYLYDIPGGSERGGHAHKRLFQLIVAVSGAFDVILDDGCDKKIVQLNRPDFGLLIVPGIWRELNNFSSGSICMVLASEKYDENDYLREYNDFLCFRENLSTK